MASLAGKRHLFSLLKPLQADLLTHGSITESEIKELDMEYKALNLKSKTKGIILAGGTGSRLYPTTEGAAKALLPVYDKPLIYYPLSILMLAQIQDILLIASPEHLPGFKRLLGDGSKFGVNLSYAVQESPQGIPDAFKVGKSFIGSSDVVLILGDNIFHGATLINSLQHSMQILSHGQGSIYSYHVKNPERFGVLAYNDAGEPIEIEEKPAKPKSNYCVTGLYFYPNDVTTQADTLTPSKRGELEITDLNNLYLYQDRLQVERLGRGCVWFDTGTPEALLQAANFVSTVQNNENLIIACLEEIAFTNGWISKEALVARGQALSMTEYGRYLLKLAENN